MKTEATVHLCFSVAIFVGATLLFACQPMIARMIVPFLGGAPAVWIVCSLCFQTLLLLGYSYAHFVGTRLPLAAQVVLQLALVGAVFLVMPVGVEAATVERWTAGHPTLGLLLLLVRAIGLPFFVLSTSSPLLQRWFAEVGEKDPYHLYAASNAGSMLALLGYPFVVEPLLAVRAQARALHSAFAVYAILVVVCAGVAMRNRSPLRIDATPAPPQVRVRDRDEDDLALPLSQSFQGLWRERVVWIGLSFAPSSLLLGATEYVTTDIASVPLLWVVPLALYLMSFIVAFAKRQWVAPVFFSRATAVAAALVAAFTLLGVERPAWLVIGSHMLLLFVGSVACHRGLAERRPDVTRLTEFYLLMSIGGVLGGAFNGLLAPLVFDDLYEYPIAIGLVCLGRAAVGQLDRRIGRRAAARDIAFGVTIAVLLLVGVSRQENGRWGATIWSDRGFFGVLKVMRDSHFQVLVGGRALQGQQALDPARANVPLAFYYATGPAGDVLGPLPEGNGPLPSRRVGVIGLGVGSLAAYARPGDRWTFFEIDPAVVGVAREYFTYLRRAESVAKLEIEVGDARLRLRRGDPERFDVLVLDAFASDAVPTHLVTREALAVYRRALRPGGVLLAHVSNAHVQLRPVFAALAKDAGLAILDRRDTHVSPEDRAAGKAPSEWVVLATSVAALPPLSSWTPVVAAPGQQVWSDDFANVLASLRF